MKKVILIAALTLTLTGCGWLDRLGATVTGNTSEVCEYGVMYLQFTSGASVAYNPDGTVKTCS